MRSGPDLHLFVPLLSVSQVVASGNVQIDMSCITTAFVFVDRGLYGISDRPSEPFEAVLL